MTEPRPPEGLVGAGWSGGGGETGAGGGAAFPAGSPGGVEEAPEGRLRRLRLAGPADRSGLATEARGAAMAGVSGTGPLAAAGAGRRLPRRLRGAVDATGS